MATHASNRQNPQGNLNAQHSFLALLFVIASALLLLGAGGIYNLLFPHNYTQPVHLQPALPQLEALPPVQITVGGLTLESYSLVNPGTRNGCAATETYQTVYGSQESRCYQTLAIPPVYVVANTLLGINAEQRAAILARPNAVLYLHSEADRNGSDPAYFHVGDSIYFAVWVSGDCTPRIFDGNGGYWVMPISPIFRSAENAPYGPGFLITLPAGWQTSWSRNPAQIADWRLCAAPTFNHNRGD